MRAAKNLSYLLLTSLTVATLPVSAENTNDRLYLSASINLNETEYETFDQALGGQINIGYKINDWFGLEAGYAELGKFEHNRLPAEVEGDVAQLNLIFEGSSGFGNINVMAKVGLYEGKLEENTISRESSELSFTYAAQALFPIQDNIDITAGWQHYSEIAEDVDINSFTLGLRIQF